MARPAVGHATVCAGHCACARPGQQSEAVSALARARCWRLRRRPRKKPGQWVLAAGAVPLQVRRVRDDRLTGEDRRRVVMRSAEIAAPRSQSRFQSATRCACIAVLRREDRGCEGTVDGVRAVVSQSVS